MRSWARAVGVVLLAIHAGLGLWAMVGFVELAIPQVAWPRLSNPHFSPIMLAWQWTLVAIASAYFFVGYTARHRSFPFAMAAIYGAMALTCAYQTFFILTDAARFRAMFIEYAEYAAILCFLFLSPEMRVRFGRERA